VYYLDEPADIRSEADDEEAEQAPPFSPGSLRLFHRGPPSTEVRLTPTVSSPARLTLTLTLALALALAFALTLALALTLTCAPSPRRVSTCRRAPTV
jgi:hypothetical protein